MVALDAFERFFVVGAGVGGPTQNDELEGLEVHAVSLTYAFAGERLDTCFQLMESDDAGSLAEWMERWRDLVAFEKIVPVMAQRAKTVAVNRG
ncbi:MAG: DUF3303 domain-containing protein [Actinomycetota bacterium]|nr:DUF3303 domain-containing protein [Actinomycetota bacterium]